jgi:hypothetical protein
MTGMYGTLSAAAYYLHSVPLVIHIVWQNVLIYQRTHVI